MKNIYLTIILMCLALGGCTKGETKIYEDEIPSKVYFVQAATSPILSVPKDSLLINNVVSLSIYDAGNNAETLNVEAFVDEESLEIYNIEYSDISKLLPEEYYTMENTIFKMDTKDNHKKFLEVTINIDSLISSGAVLGEYILPITLKTKSDTYLSFDYKTIFIKIAE